MSFVNELLRKGIEMRYIKFLEGKLREVNNERDMLLQALKESTDMLERIMKDEQWGAIEEQIVDNFRTLEYVQKKEHGNA